MTSVGVVAAGENRGRRSLYNWKGTVHRSRPTSAQISFIPEPTLLHQMDRSLPWSGRTNFFPDRVSDMHVLCGMLELLPRALVIRSRA